MIIQWEKLLDGVAISLVSAGVTYLIASIIYRKKCYDRNIDGTCQHHTELWEKGSGMVENLKNEIDKTYLKKDIYEVKHSALLDKLDRMRTEAQERTADMRDFVEQQFEILKSLILQIEKRK